MCKRCALQELRPAARYERRAASARGIPFLFRKRNACTRCTVDALSCFFAADWSGDSGGGGGGCDGGDGGGGGGSDDGSDGGGGGEITSIDVIT